MTATPNGLSKLEARPTILENPAVKRVPLAVWCALALLPTSSLHAEQQVTLKSGASLVGDVSIEGGAAVVTVGGKEMRVPLADVAVVSNVDFGREEQARRLLLAALETRLLGDERADVAATLAEAARLAPDDVHIAYWHASSLADAGMGKAAHEIFEARRAALEKAYPGRTDRLAQRIRERLELEKLPVGLVEVVDKLNRTAANRTDDGDMRQMYAVFRILDQHKSPLKQADFRVQANGNNERIEAFDDGYFLLAYEMHRSNSPEPCRLYVGQMGLKPAEIQLTAGSNRVPIADDFAGASVR